MMLRQRAADRSGRGAGDEGGLGATLLGGEAYVTFKPDLVDEAGNIADEGTRQFLQGFIDRFATLVRRLTSPESARSAA